MKYIVVSCSGNYFYERQLFRCWLNREIHNKNEATSYTLDQAVEKVIELTSNNRSVKILALTGSEEEMLPMNKLLEDVAEFIKERELKVMGTPACSEEMQALRDEVVLFANEMSDKYEELVSVELVDTLMVSYQDSIGKEKNDD